MDLLHQMCKGGGGQREWCPGCGARQRITAKDRPVSEGFANLCHCVRGTLLTDLTFAIHWVCEAKTQKDVSRPHLVENWNHISSMAIPQKMSD